MVRRDVSPTLLITGIAGFIGSNLAQAALRSGFKVRGVDDFSTGSEENLAPFRDQIQFFRGSITDPVVLQRACAGVDCIHHHAAVVSVPKSMENPIRNDAVNVSGTLNVLVAARDAGVRRVVFASSSSVYGEPVRFPISEAAAVDPLSPYAVSKAAGELYMRMFGHSFGVETVCLRYFNVFGPKQDPSSGYSGVLARFTMQMLNGLQPTIFGDGEQTRDFTYVEDVARANLLACCAPTEIVNQRTFNVATGRSVSLNQIYSVLGQITGYPRAAVYAEGRHGDIRHSVADISAIQETLGFHPTVSLEEGLRRTVQWYTGQFQPQHARTSLRPALELPVPLAEPQAGLQAWS
jgi:UDP-N-acetylglucosamine/UDP-N-acetyl-alpha-D-glucosaminouronate 4-epimerase